jgi:hypothetical protein
MKTNSSIFIFVILLLFVSCSKVPLTGRKQLNFIPAGMLTQMSLTSYQEFLSANPPDNW